MKADQRRQAEAVTVAFGKAYGRAGFGVEQRDRRRPALNDAEALGLVRWVADNRCGLTERGMVLTAQYRGEGGGDD